MSLPNEMNKKNINFEIYIAKEKVIFVLKITCSTFWIKYVNANKFDSYHLR